MICQDSTLTNEIDEDTSDQNLLKQFQNFLKSYDKTYDSLEEMTNKFNQFKVNYAIVQQKRVKYAGKTNKSNYGVTKFMDIDEETFNNQFANLKVSSEQLLESQAATTEEVVVEANNADSEAPIVQASALPFVTAAPASYDWRNYGVVGSPKNQGACGVCWAFSAIVSIEAQYARRYGVYKSFSEEQLLDCDYTNSGCGGGNQQLAYAYVKRVGGVMLSNNYPLRLSRTTCLFNKNNVAARVSGWGNAGQNEVNIKNSLLANGPLAVAINANQLQYYNGGIITSGSATCNPNTLTHGVNIVGYGTQNGIDYWIVRNSWGANWGENGYFRMARGRGTCGINKYVTYATIA